MQLLYTQVLVKIYPKPCDYLQYDA